MTVYIFVYILMGTIPLLIERSINDDVKKHKICSIMCGALIILLFALRAPSMGVDLAYGTNAGYLGMFDKISKFTWREAFTQDVLNYERGYIIFNKLVSSIWNNKQFFLAISAFVSIGPVVYVVYKKGHNAVFSYCVYMGLPVFLMLFSGIRQSIAIGICFLAVLLIEDKRLIKFILTVLFASLFHHTAIIFLVAYPLYHVKINKTGRLFSLALLPIIYLFRYPLFSLLSRLFKDDAIPVDTGAIGLLLLFVAIYLFCFMFASEEKQDNGFLNLFYFSCVCQVFAGIYSVAMRVGYYFMMFAIFLIPKTIEYLTKDENEKLTFKFIISIAFVIFGLYMLYSSAFAQAYPYIFFWRLK